MKAIIYDRGTGRILAVHAGAYWPADAAAVGVAYAPDGELRAPRSVDAETGEIAYDNDLPADKLAQAAAAEAFARLNELEAATVAEGELGAAELLSRAAVRPAWKPGLSVWAGMLFNHAGRLWQATQGTPEAPMLTQAGQPPGAEGTLALYAPVRQDMSPLSDGAPEWIYGEPGLAAGVLRSRLGAEYEAIQPPGANIWPPEAEPATWRPLAGQEGGQ
jgi:hypothetical protein